jgi:hypothetical protein
MRTRNVAQAAKIAEVERLLAGCARALPRGAGPAPKVERAEAPHLVVVLPLVGVGQHGVRLGDFSKRSAAAVLLGLASGWYCWPGAGRPS